jgi:MFS superfamily sulfate permease-like transporter
LTFDVVFGVFAAAMVAIAFLAVRWAVGRDRDEKRLREQAGDVGGSDS